MFTIPIITATILSVHLVSAQNITTNNSNSTGAYGSSQQYNSLGFNATKVITTETYLSSLKSNDNMAEYTDPQGSFFIKYPINWTAVLASNRFQPIAVYFSTASPFAEFNVARQDTITNLTDPARYLSQKNVLPFGSSLFQNVECTKYTVDGHKACDLIFTSNPSGALPLVTMAVASYFDKKMYGFSMIGTQDDFDNYLPTFGNILASFKVPALSTTQALSPAHPFDYAAYNPITLRNISLPVQPGANITTIQNLPCLFSLTQTYPFCHNLYQFSSHHQVLPDSRQIV